MMKPRSFIASLAVVTALAGCITQRSDKAAPVAPSVSFIEPADGAVISSPITVKFAVSGMELMRSGTKTPNSGHHHLLINSRASVPLGEPISFLNYQEIHFSRAQIEDRIFLPPGAYQLTLQFADGTHVSYGPAMSKTINITVKESPLTSRAP